MPDDGVVKLYATTSESGTRYCMGTAPRWLAKKMREALPELEVEPPEPEFNMADVYEGVLDWLRTDVYTGPDVEWTCLSLAATCPTVQEHLEPEYARSHMEDQGYTREELALQVIFKAGYENGFRHSQLRKH